jgi:hypothetical protein
MEGTKKCPNCGLKISKAEGCNHVKCDVSFGGCGWEFCWLCLGKYPNCGCGGFDRESERVARELAREEVRTGPRKPKVRPQSQTNTPTTAPPPPGVTGDISEAHGGDQHG